MSGCTIEVPMKVAVSEVTIPASVTASEVLIPAVLAMKVEILPVPSNYGRITYDGSVITVS